VSFDPLPVTAVDGPDVNRVLEVAVDALDLEELLVPEGDILGA
jgi:hypothetical protein